MDATYNPQKQQPKPQGYTQRTEPPTKEQTDKLLTLWEQHKGKGVLITTWRPEIGYEIPHQVELGPQHKLMIKRGHIVDMQPL